MEELNKQKIKTMCVFVHSGRTLASRGYDENKNEIFYRVLGGGVNFGEKSEDGVKREIMEELKCEIENFKLIKVIENIFTFQGKPRHEITFLYKGDLMNKSLYNQEKIYIVEPYKEFTAEWIKINDVLSGKIILYPETDYSNILR